MKCGLDKRESTVLSCLTFCTIQVFTMMTLYAQQSDFVLGAAYYAPSDTPMPQKGMVLRDPNFHTSIIRVTAKSDGYLGPGIQNEYSKADPENSDGSLAILRGNSAAYYLYNPSTYQLIRQLTAFDACNQEPEPRWDSSNPKTFYYVCNTELRSYHIDSDSSTSIHNFKKEFPSAAIIRTKMEGDASLDRRYWALMVEDSSYNLLAVIVYDRTLDSIVGQKTSGFPDQINWVGMSMSGKYCIVGYEDVAIYTDIFSRDFSTRTTLPEGSAGHGDAALTADGKDVYVYQNVRTDYISFADMSTGTETQLIHIPFEVNTDIGLHISGNCSETPGWVLVSTYGSQNPPPGRAHSWMDTQLFMLELRANPRIWRIAHTQSYTSKDYADEKNYFAEAFAAITTKGKRIYWGSNWRDYTSEYTDAYQAVLPDQWAIKIPTSVEQIGRAMPEGYELKQNYPNPFNPSTTIRFSLAQQSHVTLKVVDALGREVATLVNGELNSGEHLVVFNAKRLSSGGSSKGARQPSVDLGSTYDADATSLASGVYYYTLTSGSFSETKKMTLAK